MKVAVKILSSRMIAFAHDLLWIPMAVFLALWMRFNFDEIPAVYLQPAWLFVMLAIPLQAIANIWTKVYRGIWRYVSMQDAVNIFRAMIVGVSLTYLAAFILFRMESIPRSVIMVYPLLLFVGMLSSRVLYRGYREHRLNLRQKNAQRVLLIGAGHAGELLLRDILKNGSYILHGIIDDDQRKQGQELHGARVIGVINDLPVLLKELQPDLVFFAIHTAQKSVRNRVHRFCDDAQVRLLVLPGLAQLLNNGDYLSSLRQIQIEDLLGRTPAFPDDSLMCRNIHNKTVMLTGAGGSIGSEIARQIVRYAPSKLILFECSEFSLYHIDKELQTQCQQNGKHIEIIPVLGSVVDSERVERFCRTFGVQTLYHTAAYKHVPLVEYNPAEAVKNNVFGTLNTAQAAQRAGVECFVLISTDKAVRPTNVMGATKRFAEMVLQALSREVTGICFSMVRFGNVLGSSGSVVPLFRQQIKDGGPLTVTHPEITRYFMSIPEAAQLVIQAGAMAEGGDVFILDMGDPVKIVDLADQMIRLSGLSVRDAEHPDGDIAIEFTGLRPGEKLYEELLIDDAVMGTSHSLIMRAKDEYLPWQELRPVLDELAQAVAQDDVVTIRSLLLDVVNGYNPQCDIRDHIACANTKRMSNEIRAS